MAELEQENKNKSLRNFVEHKLFKIQISINSNYPSSQTMSFQKATQIFQTFQLFSHNYQNSDMISVPLNFTLVDDLSANTGLSTDLIKTLLLMMTSIVLAPFFRIIKQSYLRKIYAIVPGLIYLLYLHEEWSLYVLMVAIVPYFAMKLAKGREFAVSLTLGFLFLLFIHCYRFIFDYMSWRIDCSVAVMVMVTKVTYYGKYKKNQGNQGDFLTYFAYCMFFPSVLIGPTYSYGAFSQFIGENNNIKKIYPLNASKIAITFLFTLATAYLMPIFTPKWCLTNEKYLSLPPILQFLSLNFIGVIYRIKFYAAWGITQISVDLSGISWNEKSEEYDLICCGSPKFEIQSNPKNKTEYWNTSIQIWLKDVFYDSLMEKYKSSSLASYGTFFISAFWHGIYLTYYVGFIQWAMIIQINKWIYKISLNVPKLAQSPIFMFMTALIGSSFMNCTGMFIVILNWRDAVQFYANMDYINLKVMGILVVASLVVNPKIFAKKST